MTRVILLLQKNITSKSKFAMVHQSKMLKMKHSAAVLNQEIATPICQWILLAPKEFWQAKLGRCASRFDSIFG